MVQYYPAICLPSCGEGYGSTRLRIQETADSSGIFPSTLQSLHAWAATLWMYGRGKIEISRKKGQKGRISEMYMDNASWVVVSEVL